MIDGGDPGRVQQAVVTGQLTQPSMAALRVAAEDPRDTALAAAYRYLQRAVGVIAVLLPLTVAVGSAVLGGGGVRGSISDYSPLFGFQRGVMVASRSQLGRPA
jgi:hypothetical protein